MKIQVKKLVETGMLLGVFMCFLMYWSNDQRAIERIIQEIVEFDFSPREYPIDYNKYTEEADQTFRRRPAGRPAEPACPGQEGGYHPCHGAERVAGKDDPESR